jgi:hypothetical protein
MTRRNQWFLNEGIGLTVIDSAAARWSATELDVPPFRFGQIALVPRVLIAPDDDARLVLPQEEHVASREVVVVGDELLNRKILIDVVREGNECEVAIGRGYLGEPRPRRIRVPSETFDALEASCKREHIDETEPKKSN